MKTILVVINLLALFALGGCDGEDSPSATDPDPIIIVIDVLARDWPDNCSRMEVDLAMENPGQVPYFEANGEQVLYFTLHGDQISGSLSIPLADTLEFTLRSMNRVVTRSISVPRRPNMVVCNGVELVEGEPNELEPTGTYEFEWAGGIADYYGGFMDLYDPDLGGLHHWFVTESDSWAVEEPNGSPSHCSINAYVGSRREPGEVPRFRTSWAEGYVFAQSYRYAYSLDTPSGQQQSHLGMPAIDRLERIIKERKGMVGNRGAHN